MKIVVLLSLISASSAGVISSDKTPKDDSDKHWYDFILGPFEREERSIDNAYGTHYGYEAFTGGPPMGYDSSSADPCNGYPGTTGGYGSTGGDYGSSAYPGVTGSYSTPGYPGYTDYGSSDQPGTDSYNTPGYPVYVTSDHPNTEIFSTPGYPSGTPDYGSTGSPYGTSGNPCTPHYGTTGGITDVPPTDDSTSDVYGETSPYPVRAKRSADYTTDSYQTTDTPEPWILN